LRQTFDFGGSDTDEYKDEYKDEDGEELVDVILIDKKAYLERAGLSSL
jgi:hypothetical protein